MRTTEILDLLRANPGSYIEHSSGDYCIKGADGTVLLENALVHEQFDDLLKYSRIKEVGNNKYGPVDPVG